MLTVENFEAYVIPDDLTKAARMDFNRTRQVIEGYRATFLVDRGEPKGWNVQRNGKRFVVSYYFKQAEPFRVWFDELYGHFLAYNAAGGTGMQLSLGIMAPIKSVERAEGESIQQQFERFHAENPQVYEKLVEIARWCQRNGLEMGIGAMFERLRWEIAVQVREDGKYKLNNNYRSRYARLIMANEPELAGFFEVRELKS